MSRNGYAQKVDKNQKEIVTFFRRCGAYVLHLHSVKNAFDILVFFQGKTYCVEIKDGSKPPSARKLTHGEIQCKEAIEATNNKYYVVESIDDAEKLLK